MDYDFEAFDCLTFLSLLSQTVTGVIIARLHGQYGIIENEIADNLAKAALTLLTFPVVPPLPEIPKEHV